MLVCLLVTARPEIHRARGWKQQISRVAACLMRVFSFDEENRGYKSRQDFNVRPNLNPHLTISLREIEGHLFHRLYLISFVPLF